MKIAYPMRFTPADEGGYWVQGLAPLSNVLTEGATLEEALAMAREALTGVLETMLDQGQPVPRPFAAQGEDIQMIAPEPETMAPLVLRWAREDARLTQTELASRLGMTYQAVQRLERAGSNPTIRTMARVSRALGRQLEVSM